MGGNALGERLKEILIEHPTPPRPSSPIAPVLPEDDQPGTSGTKKSLEDRFPELSEALAGILESPPLDQTQSSRRIRIQCAPSIFRSKKSLQKYFEPKFYSFGPIHHGNSTLQKGEKIKLKLAAAYIHTQGLDQDKLFDKIERNILHFRQLYDEEIIKKFGDEPLSRMFFIDGCALLYYIIDVVEYNLSGKSRPLNFWPKLCHPDVFRLENQLPYKLLNLLMRKEEINLTNSFIPPNPENCINMFIAAYSFFAPSSGTDLEVESIKVMGVRNRIHILDVLWRYTGQYQPPHPETTATRIGGWTHILDVLRRYSYSQQRRPPDLGAVAIGCIFLMPTNYVVKILLRQLLRQETAANTVINVEKHMLYSINKLKQAGIRLKPGKSRKLTEITFDGELLAGRLTLDPVRLYPMMASELANLMAYEMCPDHLNYFPITSYVCFLKSLVRDAQDVAEMKSSEILHNFLPSDEAVIELLNELASDVNPNPAIYSRVISAITNYVEYSRLDPIHRLTAWIVAAAEVYFTTPQNTIPFLAAALALGLAITNTIFTILHQSKHGGH